MRRVLLHPALWLTAALVLPWSAYFWSAVAPPPASAVPTGIATTYGVTTWDDSTWASVLAVSDDGARVTVGTHRGTMRHVTSSLHVWDVRTGRDVTPGAWADPDRDALLDRPFWRDPGLLPLAAGTDGRAFLDDEAAWAAFRQWFAASRANAIDDVHRTLRPVRADERSDVFPASLQFAPDGRLLSYVARNGWPVHLISESLGDGTAVEDVRTGRRVAFLPGVTDSVVLAPGGRTAVSRLSRTAPAGEHPRLALWDLATSAARAELAAEDERPGVWYSPDGRFVFARDSGIWTGRPVILRWWDAATGRPVGRVENAWEDVLLGGGRVLVTKPRPLDRTGEAESYRLLFWDVASGAPSGEWALEAPADGGGLFKHLIGSGGDRYLAAV